MLLSESDRLNPVDPVLGKFWENLELFNLVDVDGYTRRSQRSHDPMQKCTNALGLYTVCAASTSLAKRTAARGLSPRTP